MPIEQNRPCVLVVEQDAVSRELLRRTLHLAGFATIGVGTGERALLLLREHGRAIDWLVTNGNLPGLVDRGILADEFLSYHPARAVLVGADLALAHSSPTPPGAVAGFPTDEIVAQLRALRDAEDAADRRGGDHALAA